MVHVMSVTGFCGMAHKDPVNSRFARFGAGENWLETNGKSNRRHSSLRRPP